MKTKSYVIVQPTPPRTHVSRKDEKTGVMLDVPNYRARWRLLHGADFVKKFFPRTKNWNFDVHTLSNNQVKALIFHAKQYPKVLEVAVFKPETPLIPDVGEAGDYSQAELPEGNESGSCDAVSGVGEQC
jgi:hypothetical protein